MSRQHKHGRQTAEHSRQAKYKRNKRKDQYLPRELSL